VSLVHSRAADHIRLSIRLTPNGGSDSLGSVEEDAAGKVWLKARVTAVPDKGRANKALIALVAKKLGVARSSVTLLSGDTSRQKILRIDGDPEDLCFRLQQILDA